MAKQYANIDSSIRTGATGGRTYSAPYNSTVLPQSLFAQYAYKDPWYATGMLLGNGLTNQYLQNQYSKLAAQDAEAHNTTSLPNDAQGFDPTTTPRLADGTSAMGNAYSGFGGKTDQVAPDLLSNLQNVARMNYNPDTGAVAYQTPTFLPSMYTESPFSKYFPTHTDDDGRLLDPNFSFANYLNARNGNGDNGQGLLNFQQLGAMAAADQSQDPRQNVAANTGVLPTANVAVPPQSQAGISAIDGNMGKFRINGNLNYNVPGLTLPGNNPNLKSDGNVADALPGTETSANIKPQVATINGKHYVLPAATKPNGEIGDADQAAFDFYKTGNILGEFKTEKEAREYAMDVASGKVKPTIKNIGTDNAAPIQEQPAAIQPVDTAPIKEEPAPIQEQPTPIQPVADPIQAIDSGAQAAQMAQTAQTPAQDATTPAPAQTTTTNMQTSPSGTQGDTGPLDEQKLMEQLYPGAKQIDNPEYKKLHDQYVAEKDPTKQKELMDKLTNTPAYLLETDNPTYIASKAAIDKMTDPKKKAEAMQLLDNIQPKLQTPFAPQQESLTTDLTGGTPPHFDAVKREANLVQQAAADGVPWEAINAYVNNTRPAWEDSENDYNQYMMGSLYPSYANAINKGDWTTAANTALLMSDYNPALASQMLNAVPNGKEIFSAMNAQQLAAAKQQAAQAMMVYKTQAQMNLAKLNGGIRETLNKERYQFEHNEKEADRAERRYENDSKNQTTLNAAQIRATSKAAGANKPSKGDMKIMNHTAGLYHRAIDAINAGEEDPDVLAELTNYVKEHAVDMDEDTSSVMWGMAYYANGYNQEKQGASSDTVSDTWSKVPRYILEQLDDKRNWDGYK